MVEVGELAGDWASLACADGFAIEFDDGYGAAHGAHEEELIGSSDFCRGQVGLFSRDLVFGAEFENDFTGNTRWATANEWGSDDAVFHNGSMRSRRLREESVSVVHQ